jgi:hypothetical protein
MTQRTSAEILAELTEFRAARAALIKGERVEDVWRDGCRMRLSKVSLADMNTAISGLENELESALAVEAGQRPRRAIGLAWRN